jgi:hypothetical protein
MSAYIKNTERSQANNLMLHLKLLENQEQAKPKRSRRRETKIRGRGRGQKSPPNQQNKKLVL